MPNRFVSVDQDGRLPTLVVDRLAERFVNEDQVNVLSTAQAGQYVNLNSSAIVEPNKVLRRDTAGLFKVGTPVDAAHPVTLGMLDSRVPAGGYPVATQVAQGLMSSGDKAKLDGTTASPTANTIAYRGASGELRVAVTTGVDHAARKDYVDNHKWAGETITSGIIDPARIANATAIIDGLMSKADKSKLDAATASAVNSTVVARDAGGGTTFTQVALATAAPTIASHATRKDYVDGKKWSGADITSGTVDPARIANATAAIDGLMSIADKTKLDSATSANTANAIVMRDTLGAINARNIAATVAVSTLKQTILNDAPTATNHAARKDYVDTKVWAGEAITSGTISDLRIANASSVLDGLMPKADKTKLDAASTGTTAGTLALRGAAGELSAKAFHVGSGDAQSTNAFSMTRKDYVDALIAGRMMQGGDLGTTNINTVNAPGFYYNATTGNVTVANGYPTNGGPGALDVRRFHSSATPSSIIQEWTQWSPLRKWGRSSIDASSATPTWTAWTEITSPDAITYMGSLSNVNLNTVLTTGIYSQGSATYATLANNFPWASSTGTLLVTPQAGTGGTHVVQEWTAGADGRKAFRSTTDGGSTWTAWNEIVTTTDLATSSKNGLLSMADKAKLDAATTLATANAIAMRTTSGRLTVGTPTATTDATTKAYVDAKVWDGTDIATGLISPLRIANATAALDGLMVKTDKAKLDAATTSATANAIVMRDASGRIKVGTPAANDEATTKLYVDTLPGLPIATIGAALDLNNFITTGDFHQNLDADAASGTNYPAPLAGLLEVRAVGTFVWQRYTVYSGGASGIYWRGKFGTNWSSWAKVANTTLASSSVDGLMSNTDKAKLDAASYTGAFDTLVRLGPSGQVTIPTVWLGVQNTSTNAATRKDYVDAKTWAGEAITTGTISDLRIANASSVKDGLMPKLDKAKLDAATTGSNPDTLVMRSAAGQFNVQPPTSSAHVATKSYVDNLPALPITVIPAAQDLNNYITSGDFVQNINADAVSGLNYPEPVAGLLLVRAVTDFVYQTYKTYNATNHSYYRTKYLTNWSPWAQVADTATLASSSVDGLMSKVDKAKLDAANAGAIGNTLALRDGGGGGTFAQVALATAAPTIASHATRKDYVDAQVATKANVSHAHSGADITSGTISPLRIANATAALDGLMAKADKAKLDAASAVSSNSTIALRTSTGHLYANVFLGDSSQSSAVNAMTRKDYVDAQVATKANASHVHSGTDITTGTISPLRIANATAAIDGLMSSVDKAKLDAATNGFGEADTIVTRNANKHLNADGYFVPSANPQIDLPHVMTRKDYVDGKTWAAEDITSGVFAAARLPVATTGVHGAMSAADKTKLDAATANATGSTLAMRLSDGRISVGEPTSPSNATTKLYVDSIFIGPDIPSTGNLNNYITPGIYTQSLSAEATTALNYPGVGIAGKLEVTMSEGGTFVYQTYTEYSSTGRIWYRTKYQTTWYAWKQLATQNDFDNRALGAVAGGTAICPNANAFVVTGNTWYRGEIDIVFPAGRFATPPMVMAIASSTVPGIVIDVTVHSITTTGCTIVAARVNTTSTAINWLAVEVM